VTVTASEAPPGPPLPRYSCWQLVSRSALAGGVLEVVCWEPLAERCLRIWLPPGEWQLLFQCSVMRVIFACLSNHVVLHGSYICACAVVTGYFTVCALCRYKPGPPQAHTGKGGLKMSQIALHELEIAARQQPGNSSIDGNSRNT
jgi:hypothetical protein